ncbi:MAG: SusD/RagB family nutrient-binding outer membrane lipoprotein, partial [Prevotella bivia]|nr:SusD/RagB family nutrient-binding outer membrane lipoprotein [Prevotella bivia]
VIEKNEDNLEIAYNPNGQWKTSVEWGDSRACADIESYMYGYGDPRLSKYFSNTKTKGKRPIIGCRAGAKIGNKKIAGESYSAANVTQLTKGVWMTAAEMAFCKAEGAMLNWKMGDTPENLYNLGIKLSFDQWGAANVDNYINDATKTMASYEDADINYGGSAGAVSNITIKWEAGNDAANKERLAVQKWIAMFPDGQEGWNEIRRTGYPKVFPVAQNTGSALNVPNRIPFDQDESVQNKDNYLKAVQLLKGNDDYTTKMWWQK